MRVGIDLVEHARIKLHLANRILSEKELVIFNGLKNKKRQIEYIASRFAVKEAIFKVYQQGDKTFMYSDISVLNYEHGAPYIECPKLHEKLEVSITHTSKLSQAIVIRP